MFDMRGPKEKITFCYKIPRSYDAVADGCRLVGCSVCIHVQAILRVQQRCQKDTL